jgi:hypothetical protein
MEEQDKSQSPISPVARRSFLTGIGTGVTLLGTAGAMLAQTPTPAPVAATPNFQPARHAQDDWLDQIPGKHRCIFDTTTPEGANSAGLFANNYYTANLNTYSVQNADLAVVVVLRHSSTPFAYNDAIWAKYGVPISQQMGNFVDPRSKQTPVTNIYKNSLEGLIRRGAHLAVCQMATRNYAGVIGRATGGSTDAIYEELVANLLGNAHMVPAGIVALNRAQEKGYTFVHAV